MFDEAGQLTSTTTTGANAGSASYTFDGAGNRSSQTVNGAQASFGHDPAGRLLSTQTEGRSTSYTYYGLDRRTSVTDATAFGSDTTSTTWDGLTPVATDSAQHGVTDLLRDPTGVRGDGPEAVLLVAVDVAKGSGDKHIDELEFVWSGENRRTSSPCRSASNTAMTVARLSWA
ncbi:RHS repeat domain-containing protein [Microbacterium sp. NPDC008134]|uniref:RHS repeat domain-containing protein n=1 Tax=Microbacterium sp. NPDC008134 TaxID=3364183 RepID=UPI0036E9CA79